jgi:hypothetical protein
VTEIHPSAREHGIADDDIEHALEHALAIEDAGEDPRDADACEVPEAAGLVSKHRVYGHTTGGKPITDEDVKRLAGEAEAGYDVDQLIARRSRGGRPPLGSSAARVESVRLDPELREALRRRAKRDHETTSSVIRKALRNYLETG